jgi:hypothetical protein
VGSTLFSLVLHVVFAALFIAVIASTSKEGATENVQGGEVITIERRSPIAVAVQAPVSAALPVPHAPRIAPIQHAPLVAPQRQQLPQNQHELAREAPTAPPNPRPIPQQSPQPAPQPTQQVFEPRPSNELPAAPISVPTFAPVAVAVKAPPTAAPSPAPSARASAAPQPKPPAPTAAPSAKPAPPATIAPSAAPTAVAVASKASAAPSQSPAPAASASAPPAAHPGVPSPSPTSVAAVAKTAGTSASPGPKGTGSPGPRPGPQSARAPARPIQIQPTQSPAPAASTGRTPVDINARLRAMLPNGPVTVTSKQYTPQLSLHGRLEPTPPPEVLAQTKYMYDVHGTGNEGEVRMWVISAKKAGPTTMCTGWLVRYPEAERGGYAQVPSNDNIAPANGGQLRIGGGGAQSGPVSSFESGTAPIVEGIVTMACSGRRLTPYATSAGSSP